MNESALTSAQLAELRQHVQNGGYLPLCNKAERLLDELERRQRRDPSAGGVAVAELRKTIRELGYLPQSRALRLIDAVAQSLAFA